MINFKRFEEIAYALLPKHRGSMRCFHVAGLYKKQRLIALGVNSEKTHPKIRQYNYHKIARCHSELMVLLRGGLEDYRGHKMLVLRIDRNDRINNSRPCNGCLNACKQLGVDIVYYSNHKGEYESLIPNETETVTKPDRFNN